MHLCQRYIETKPFFRMARSVFELNEELLTVIHAFKYKGHMHLANPLGLLLAMGYDTYYEELPVDMIIPVPLHRQKACMRGFNQSYSLANEMAKYTKRCSDIIKPFVLKRVKNTISQTGLSREERWKNMQDAFGINKKINVMGKRILIVDDILTTGATVNMCAKVLMKNKAESVDVLTLARAPL